MLEFTRPLWAPLAEYALPVAGLFGVIAAVAAGLHADAVKAVSLTAAVVGLVLFTAAMVCDFLYDRRTAGEFVEVPDGQ